jgi:hypothetical protein
MYNQTTGLIVHTLGSLETTCTCCVSILVDLCNSSDRFDGTDPWLFINNLYMLCVKGLYHQTCLNCYRDLLV